METQLFIAVGPKIYGKLPQLTFGNFGDRINNCNCGPCGTTLISKLMIPY